MKKNTDHRLNLYSIGFVISLILLFVPLREEISPKLSNWVWFSGPVLLLVLLASSSGFLPGMPQRLRSAATPFILVMFLWSTTRAIHAPDSTLALGEAFRLTAGASAYFFVAFSINLRRSIPTILGGVVGITSVLSLINFSQLAEQGGVTGNFDFSILGTHEDMGSLYLLVLPLCISVAIATEIKMPWRISGFTSSAILSFSLILTRCRSAFAGIIISISVIILIKSIFYFQHRAKLKETRHNNKSLFLPITFIIILMAIFIVTFKISPTYLMRDNGTGNVFSDGSFYTRVHMWRGAILMLSEKPLMGWGLGAYTGLESQWTHLGWDLNTVKQHGFTHLNLAHNYYVQWAADTGSVGLFLYLASLLTFLFTSLIHLQTFYASVPSEANSLKIALLTGIVASIMGASVDAISSSSYNFQGVSTLWWVLLGVGTRLPESNREKSLPPEDQKRMLNAQLIGSFLSLVITIVVLQIGNSIRKSGNLLPLGILSLENKIEIDKNGKKWRLIKATFLDENNKEMDTLPGTVWSIDQNLTKDQIKYKEFIKPPSDKKKEDRYSILYIRESVSEGITVNASYTDNYGRRYEKKITL